MRWLGMWLNLALAVLWLGFGLHELTAMSFAFAAVCAMIAATGFTGA